MFEILSIGDSKYLADVLNSLAMLTATDSFLAMCKIAVIVGVIGVVFSSLMNGGKSIDYHHILVAYIIWACMFVPKVTVQIEDKYTNIVYNVDNVPLGPAAAGTLVSSVGSTLTDLFEVAYSPIIPGMSTTSFLESLQLLTNAREVSSNSMLYTALDEDADNNLSVRKSIVEYIKNCTLKKIDLDITDYATMRTQSYEDAIKFITPVFVTNIYSTTGTSTTVGCDVAWNTHLSKDVKIDTATIAQMGALFGFNASNLKAGETAKDKLDIALNTLTGASISADTYMKTVLYESLYAEAAGIRLHEGLHGASSVAVNQAIQQRNSDWAGGHSVFMTTVRPMIAFFEAFIYAITPVMAFSILLGALGIKLAMKYFMLILWVQLWYPLLSIINLYIYSATIREFETHSAAATFNWDSFYAISSSDIIAQTWISTGGLLATSTPAIALFLVTGSAVAFTSLSSKLAGSDYYNEKQNAPDMTSAKPLMETTSLHQANKSTGQVTGVGGTTDNTSWSASNAASATGQVARTVGETNQKILSDAVASSKSADVITASNQAVSSAIDTGITASGSSEARSGWTKANDTMRSAGLTASQSDAVNNAFKESLSGGGSLDFGVMASKMQKNPDGSKNEEGSKALQKLESQTGKKGGGALQAAFGVEASATTTGTSTSGSGTEIGSSSKSGFSIGEAGAAALQRAYAERLSNSTTLTNSVAEGSKDASTVQAAASNVVSANDSLTHSRAMTQSQGSAQSFDPKKFSAPGLSTTQPIFNDMNSALRSGGYGQQIDGLARDFSAPGSPYGEVDRDTAMNMAVATLAMNPQNLQGIENQPAVLAAATGGLQKLFNAHQGGGSNPMPSTPIPGPNAPLAGPSSGAEQTANDAGHAAAVSGATAKAPGSPTHYSPSTGFTGNAEKVHDSNVNRVEGQAKEFAGKTFDDASKDAGVGLLAQGADTVVATSPKAGGILDAVTGEGNSRIAHAVRAASESNRFDDAMRGSPEDMAQFRKEVADTNAGRQENLAGENPNMVTKGGAAAAVGLVAATEYALGAVEKAKGLLNSDGSGPDWAKFNENAQNIPMQELGQMSAYGALGQLQNGVEAYTSFKNDMHDSMYQVGMTNGLTSAQANVFADSFVGSNKANNDALRAEVYATHSDPSTAAEAYKDMTKILNGASSSAEMPESYLAPVANYNGHVGNQASTEFK